MKTKITLLLAMACSALYVNSQVIFSEGFTSVWTPTAQGWSIVNNSQPVGTTSLIQGNGAATFPAFVGAPDDFIAMNYNSTSGAGGISTWLITPTLVLMNGMVFEFATRTTTGTPVYPDRLQVRMSPVINTSVPSGSASVGTFTNLMLDINPNLTTLTNTSVSNGTVNGYPQAWTVYSLTVSGLSFPTIGNIAFRYFVQNGGISGNNSNYIGIDEVKLSTTCSPPSISIAQATSGICAGNTLVLTASSTGTNAATTFSWNTGAITPSIAVSPSVTTNYAVLGIGSNTCVGAQFAVVNVTAAPTVSVSSSQSIACVGQTLTLTGFGAATYTWSGSITSTVNPVVYSTGSVPGVKNFTVTGTSAQGCSASQSISLTVDACVGLEANAFNATAISVFPNPFSSEINVSGFVGKVEVFNSLGQLVISQSIDNGKVSTSELTKGAYIVKLVANEGSIQKVINLIKN